MFILDDNNRPMTGAMRYTMTFTGAMPYAKAVPPGFWSLTMYDKTTNYSAPNSINRYSLGSIKHVIVLIGENQTFDNVYATYVPFASGSASLARASPT